MLYFFGLKVSYIILCIDYVGKFLNMFLGKCKKKLYAIMGECYILMPLLK